MFNADKYWITVAEMKGFSAIADIAFSQDERDALTELIALNPLSGEIIPDTDGVRRLKIPAASQGRGRATIVYYFRDLNTPVYLLAVYLKGDTMRISAGEKAEIRLLIRELVESHRQARDKYAAANGAA